MKYVIDGKVKLSLLRSSYKNPTLYFSFLSAYAEGIKVKLSFILLTLLA